MRSFTTYDRSSSTKSLTVNDLAIMQKEKRSSRPDWMKRLQEQRKLQREQAEQAEQDQNKNCDLALFQSFNKSISSEITYLDDEDEDELAASYFGASNKNLMEASCSSITLDSDDALPAVSGYHFDELIAKDTPTKSGYNFDKIIGWTMLQNSITCIVVGKM